MRAMMRVVAVALRMWSVSLEQLVVLRCAGSLSLRPRLLVVALLLLRALAALSLLQRRRRAVWFVRCVCAHE